MQQREKLRGTAVRSPKLDTSAWEAGLECQSPVSDPNELQLSPAPEHSSQERFRSFVSCFFVAVLNTFLCEDSLDSQ